MKVRKKEKTISVSVRELISEGEDLITKQGMFPFRIRTAQGNQIHRDYQLEHKFEIEQEVSIQITRQVKDWTFIIKGRADCVKYAENQVIIEEIKSVQNLGTFAINSRIAQFYIKQLMVYSQYFFDKGNKIKTRLILVDIISKRENTVEIPFGDHSEFILERCRNILANWKSENELKALKRKRKSTIVFPFNDFRQGQEEIVKKTDEVLNNGDSLMVCAPSGLGKTVASLFPALTYTIKKNKRLFIITPKTTQQKIYIKTLKEFEKKGAKFQSIIITAKEKQCINDIYMCDINFCKYLENYEKVNLSDIIDELLKKQILTDRHIKKIAKEHKICPFELTLDCSLDCDLIIGDYNYVFNPMIRLKRYFDRSYKDIILVIDEAHNLPFRATGYYSPSMSLVEINNAINSLNNSKIPNFMFSDSLKLLLRLKQYFEIQFSVDQPPSQSLINLDEKIFSKTLNELEKFLLIYIIYVRRLQNRFPTPKDEFISFILNLRQFYDILKESDEPEFDQIIDYSEKEFKILCKSAHRKLAKQMKGFHSVIAQSATFYPIDYYQRMLGFSDDVHVLDVPISYPQSNRLYAIDSTISTKYQDRYYSYKKIAGLVNKIIMKQPGNYLMFFPSFKYLNEVKKEINEQALPVELLIQDRKMSEKRRKDYLKLLKDENKKYLLMGVLGGIFSEGIDFYGDMAIGAFIIGPGLPAYCFEQELIKQYYQNKWNKGFEYAYRNIGMMKVIQGAGRVFRALEDKGIVMLIGSRFLNPYYNKILPNNWNIEHPHDIEKRLQSFWVNS